MPRYAFQIEYDGGPFSGWQRQTDHPSVMVTSVILAFVPMWQHVWSVINRPLVLISGVIYLHDRVPQPYQDYLWWNPLVHVVGQMRRAFYPQYVGEYVTLIYPFAVGLVLIALGLALLNRFSRDIVMQL